MSSCSQALQRAGVLPTAICSSWRGGLEAGVRPWPGGWGERLPDPSAGPTWEKAHAGPQNHTSPETSEQWKLRLGRVELLKNQDSSGTGQRRRGCDHLSLVQAHSPGCRRLCSDTAKDSGARGRWVQAPGEHRWAASQPDPFLRGETPSTHKGPETPVTTSAGTSPAAMRKPQICFLKFTFNRHTGLSPCRLEAAPRRAVAANPGLAPEC